jgi:ubiquinone biosynthesis protein UbiJ
MLAAGALRFVNHLLAGERWARQRLIPFAGQVARVEYGDWSFPVRIADDGLILAAEADAEVRVRLRLPDDAAQRFVNDRASLFGATQISGSADFAEALAFVARNLRWDIEDDLSRFVGDIAARRLFAGGRRFGEWQLDAARRGAQNVAEYLTFEQPTIAARVDVAALCAAIDTVRDDAERLEKRLQIIEKRVPARGAR